MLPYTFISEFLSSIAKPAISGLTAFFLAITPAMPENMANFVDTALSSAETSRIKIEVSYITPGNIGLMTDDLDDEGNNYGEFDLYLDLDNPSVTAVFGENDEYIMEVDPYTIRYSPALTDVIMAEYAEDGKFSYYYDVEQADVDKAYTENFKGKAYTESTPEYLEGQDVYFNDIVGFEEHAIKHTEESLSAVVGVVEHYFSKLSSKEMTELTVQYHAPQLELLGKFFEKQEVDGKTTYSFYIDGLDYAANILESDSILSDEEDSAFLEKVTEIMLRDFDVEKHAKQIFGDYAYEYGMEIIKEMLVPVANEGEYGDVEYDVGFVGLESLDGESLKAILTYDPKEIPVLNETNMLASYLYPYFANSYIAASVTAMDEETTVGDFTICIYNGEEALEYSIDFAISDYDGEIPAPDSGKGTFTPDDLNTKIAKAEAQKKGVYETEICWLVGDCDNAEKMKIRYSDVMITFLDDASKKLLTGSIIDKFSEENKAVLKELIDYRLYMWDLCFGTDVKIIQDSAYLPLRQICELCGFDVEWDSAESKAYVIRDGNKVDMTGALVDGRTYVKIRDFEKLGLTIDYNEEVYEEDGVMYKYCNVMVSFFK